ncbi:isochorismatase family protein [Sphingomonas oligophenolica]|uniref:Isochorismatase family protein n=1 Tax=Sphingomonas oligophenolica TaxID=301154 RepID=A0A502CUE9_9SPHN|nr:isochorismatase family protein [Sphingomonas oligophenolica]TPG15371.1 isochorismatase family protein [Sphingomonas oligophenolica]
MTTQADYLEQLTPDNAAVLFIDNQTTLTLGVQSIDLTVLKANIEGLARLARMFGLPVVLTTTGGGADGPSGGLLKGITDAFPEVDIVNRTGILNAMDDPRFAAAVEATARRKIILSGITTDFCLVYPALSLIAAGYHVFVAVDASGSWTSAINDAALQRLIQAGATPTNVQSIFGELQNTATNRDAEAAKSRMSEIMEWLDTYTPAPSLIGENFAARQA